MDYDKLAAIAHRTQELIADSVNFQSFLISDDALILDSDPVKGIPVSDTVKEVITAIESDFIKEEKIKKILSAAIHIAKDKNVLPFEVDDLSPEKIAELVDGGLNRAKIAYQVGIGNIDIVDAIDNLIDRQTAVVGATVDSALKHGLVSDVLSNGVVSLLSAFKVPNAKMYEPIIKTQLYRIEQKSRPYVQAGIKKIAEVSKVAVHKTVKSVKNYAKSVVKKIFS